MRGGRLGASTLLALAFGIAAALVVGEFFVRLYEGDPLLPLVPQEPYVDNAVLYRKSPSRRYALSPSINAVVGRDAIRIQTNRAGFRDERDYSLDKKEGTFRIVVLGDSFTFAGKVPLPGTFPKVLERRLKSLDPKRDYEVLNLAVPGYNTEQEAVTLEELGLAYSPDLVIVAFVLNDALPQGQLVPGRSWLPAGVRHLLKRSYLVQFLYGRSRILRSLWKKGSFKGSSEVADLREGSPGFLRVEAALGRISRASKSKGARLLLVVWPMFERLREYPFAEQHALVEATSNRLGIPVLDLLASFRGQDESRLWVQANDHHPNQEAQRVAAESILRELKARGLVPSLP